MVKRKTFVFAIFILGIVAGSALGAAQSSVDPNAPQTLDEYLRYAALHNAGLQAAFEEWKAALEQIPQAKALPDPRFSYGYFVEQLNTRQQAGIMQTFPWFGKIRARTDAAAAAAKAAQRRYEARKQQLFFDVTDAFYEYVYLAGAIRIAKENLELTRHFEEVARTKHITAAASHPDVIRAQIEVVRLQNDLTTLEDSRIPAVARVNAVLNRPAEAPLPWPQEGPGGPAKIDRQALMAALKEHNPTLQAKGFEIEQLTREVALAKRSFYPDVGVGAEWMSMAMSDRGNNNNVRVGIELNLPLWRSSYRASELQARATARRAQHERKDMENDLLARTERVLYEYENDGRQASLYGDVLVPKAQDLIGTSEAAYLDGTIDFLRLIDAQQTLLQFRLQRERFGASQQQRRAELEMLVGTSLSGTADTIAGGVQP